MDPDNDENNRNFVINLKKDLESNTFSVLIPGEKKIEVHEPKQFSLHPTIQA